MTADQELGRAAHEAWKAWRIAGGYPDHAYRRFLALDGVLDPLCEVCVGRKSAHHEDMVPYDELSPEKQAKYQAMAEAGARVERERWTELQSALNNILSSRFDPWALAEAIDDLEALAMESAGREPEGK